MFVITEENVEKLKSNPAVDDFDGVRITWSREFREDVMRRYYEGESPVKIFREAGLGPEVIGAKRIERCIARWRGGIPEERDEKRPSRRKLERMISASDESIAKLMAAKDEETEKKIAKVRQSVNKTVREKDALIKKQAQQLAELQAKVDEFGEVFSQLGALGLGRKRRKG